MSHLVHLNVIGKLFSIEHLVEKCRVAEEWFGKLGKRLKNKEAWEDVIDKEKEEAKWWREKKKRKEELNGEKRRDSE